MRGRIIDDHLFICRTSTVTCNRPPLTDNSKILLDLFSSLPICTHWVHRVLHLDTSKEKKDKDDAVYPNLQGNCEKCPTNFEMRWVPMGPTQCRMQINVYSHLGPCRGPGELNWRAFSNWKLHRTMQAVRFEEGVVKHMWKEGTRFPDPPEVEV